MSESILERAATTETPQNVLVAGASGGIGQAFCQQLSQQFPQVSLIRLARDTSTLQALDAPVQDIGFDITREDSIEQALAEIHATAPIDWVFVATGWLHDAETQPEKTYRSLQADHLLRSFRINAIGPALLVKQLLERLPRKHPLKIGILSARVGSISDNHLGGWHSYRASKAALNMLIKNFSIELQRMRRPVTIVGLQPGTTDTALSRPFQRNVPPEQLQTPDYTAGQLIKVMQVLKPEDSGQLFDFLGLRFDP